MNTIIKKARQRAWLETRNVLLIAVSGVLGTTVAVVIAALIYR